MGRFIYRMCLVLVLAVAVAGGVYYYTTFYQNEEGPQKGTFVNNTYHYDTKTDSEIYGMVPKHLQEKVILPVAQTNEQGYMTAEQADQADITGIEAVEAFLYMQG